MKLQDIAPLVEEQEYSQEFAAMINEAAGGEFQEVDGDALISHIDQMIAKAEQNGEV